MNVTKEPHLRSSAVPRSPYPSCAFHSRHRDEKPVTATPLELCPFARRVREESALTNRDARNSFRSRSYENCRVSRAFFNSSCQQFAISLSLRFFYSFLFIDLHTLPSYVSSNSFVCHSYEKCRGVYQLFPFWNSPISRCAISLYSRVSCFLSSLPPYFIASSPLPGGALSGVN